MALALAFLVNNYLIFWRDWPGIVNFFGHQGWFGAEPPRKPLAAADVSLGWFQLASYLVVIGLVVGTIGGKLLC